jgi:hypothetical protein
MCEYRALVKTGPYAIRIVSGTRSPLHYIPNHNHQNSSLSSDLHLPKKPGPTAIIEEEIQHYGNLDRMGLDPAIMAPLVLRH